MQMTAVQIVGILFAFSLLYLAYRFLARDKDAKSYTTALLAVIVLLASVFQGFFQTHIIGKIFDTNRKLDDFQETIKLMKNELLGQQAKIRQTQLEIQKQEM